MKYTLSAHRAWQDWRITIVVPEMKEAFVLQRDLAPHGVEVVVMRESLSGFLLDTRRMLRQRDFDLVHAHGFTSALIGAMARTGRGIPLLVTQHDVILEHQYRKVSGRVARWLLGRVLKSADRVHAVSHAAARNLEQNFGNVRGLAEKIVPILNGIRPEAFASATPLDLRSELGIAPQSLLVGFFGRFMGQKGFRYLVDAMDLLRNQGFGPDDVTVLAVGGGGFRASEERMLESRELTKHFRFIDFTPDISRHLASVDVVAMPSLWEACGLLAMETLAAGTPLIVSDCEALLEITENTPAVRVPKANAAALAAALSAFVRNRRQEEFAAFQAEAGARYSVDSAAVALAALSAQIAAKRDR